MIIYTSAAQYIDKCTDLKARLVRVDAIILALETTALNAAVNGDVSEYSLDDGQTKIKTMYRNPQEVERSILAFERIRERIIIKLRGGRMTQLSDQSNFRRRM